MTSKELRQSFTPTDIKFGDFYYSDGTTSDGGYRRYTDDTDALLPAMPVLTDASNQPRTVVGIVYWVGDPTNSTDGDPLLKANHLNCTHGLVVALHEAKNPSANAAKMNWSVDFEQVNDWTNHADRGENKVDITEQNKLQGYANTVALKAYNKDNHTVWADADYKVNPMAAIKQYDTDYPAPTGSSGWYVPSVRELRYLFSGQENNTGKTSLDRLNRQLEKVGGTQLGNLSTNYIPWEYWSSTEYNIDVSKAWRVDFNDSYADYRDKSTQYWVRAVIAF